MVSVAEGDAVGLEMDMGVSGGTSVSVEIAVDEGSRVDVGVRVSVGISDGVAVAMSMAMNASSAMGSSTSLTVWAVPGPIRLGSQSKVVQPVITRAMVHSA